MKLCMACKHYPHGVATEDTASDYCQNPHIYEPVWGMRITMTEARSPDGICSRTAQCFEEKQ